MPASLIATSHVHVHANYILSRINDCFPIPWMRIMFFMSVYDVMTLVIVSAKCIYLHISLTTHASLKVSFMVD